VVAVLEYLAELNDPHRALSHGDSRALDASAEKPAQLMLSYSLRSKMPGMKRFGNATRCE